MLSNNNSTTHYLPQGDENVNGTKNVAIVNCVLNAPLMLITIVGNSLVLASVITNSSLRSPSIILLCGLAVSDLAVGLVVQPFYIAYLLKDVTSIEFIRSMTTMLGFAFCGISFATMALISLDRYFALRYHLAYGTIVTSSRVVVTLIIVWLVHLLLLNYFWYPSEYIYLGFVFLSVYITVSTVSYIGIYRIIRRHQLQIQVQQQAVQRSNAKITLNMMSLQRTAVNTFVFYVCTILCYFPWFIYRLCYGDIFVSSRKTAWMFTITLVFANSSLNPFLYGWRLRDLRIAVVKTLRKMLRKTEGNTATSLPYSNTTV